MPIELAQAVRILGWNLERLSGQLEYELSAEHVVVRGQNLSLSLADGLVVSGKQGLIRFSNAGSQPTISCQFDVQATATIAGQEMSMSAGELRVRRNTIDGSATEFVLNQGAKISVPEVCRMEADSITIGPDHEILMTGNARLQRFGEQKQRGDVSAETIRWSPETNSMEATGMGSSTISH